MTSGPARTFRRAAQWTLGITLIGLGVLGWFVPLLQGWVLILAGLAVLSSRSRWARAVLERIKRFGRGVRGRLEGKRRE
jgi:uncharacterized membrane protein YbaN (DUF454 family)